MDFPTDRTAHTVAFDDPVVDHWLERKIAQTANRSTMQDYSAMQEDSNLYVRVLYHLSYVPVPEKAEYTQIYQKHNPLWYI